jgi:hypothetical protein
VRGEATDGGWGQLDQPATGAARPTGDGRTSTDGKPGGSDAAFDRSAGDGRTSTDGKPGGSDAAFDRSAGRLIRCSDRSNAPA